MALGAVCFEADIQDQPLEARSFTRRKQSKRFPMKVPHGFSQVSVFYSCPCLQNAEVKKNQKPEFMKITLQASEAQGLLVKNAHLCVIFS